MKELKKHVAAGSYILAKIESRDDQTVRILSVGQSYTNKCYADNEEPLKTGCVCHILIGDHPIIRFNGEDALVLNSSSIVSVEV